MAKVMVVEDDVDLRGVLLRGLREEGFEAAGVGTGAELLDQFDHELPNVLIVDIGLPDADGRDVCQALRAQGVTTPVLFLSARDALTDRVTGFSAGGDDYVTKPFAFAELVARLHALMRRAGETGVLQSGGLRLDPLAHAAFVGDQKVALTPTEFRLLAKLIASPGQAIRRRDLVQTGWPHGARVRDNTLDAYIARLRRKLSPYDGSTEDRHRARRRLRGRMRPIRSVRTRLLLVVVAAVTLALTAATIGFNLLIASSTDGTETSTLRQRAHDERELLRIVDGAPCADRANERPARRHEDLDLRRQPDDRGAARASDDGALRQIARSRAEPLRDHPQHRRATLLLADRRRQGRRVGTIVTGISLSPYEQTKRSALIASLAFAATVLGIAVAAAAWLLRSALRPVGSMTQQAETWSEQDLDRRFGFDNPHDELTRLGFTLDRLLDRIAASLRHERRFSAELSHELRTPLAKLTAETELALRRPRTPEEYRWALGEIHDHAQQLARIVDALLAAARQEASPLGVADAVAVARAAADVCQPLADDLGVELDVAEDTPTVRVGVDPDLAERILHPVLDNACRYARAHVRVSLARSDGVVVFSVSDDGPGVGVDEAESIFEPAMRGAAGRRAGPSAGLGLALARRLARSASGDVEAEPSLSGGRFSIRLPAA